MEVDKMKGIPSQKKFDGVNYFSHSETYKRKTQAQKFVRSLKSKGKLARTSKYKSGYVVFSR
jgi:hypothetical protein